MSFLYRWRQRVDQALLPWYERYPRLHRWRLTLAYGKALAVQKKKNLWHSKQNLPALQALAQRRFDAYACASAQRQPLAAIELAGWPAIDVSIVTFNSSAWLAEFMASLCAQSYPLKQLHLYFVDNGSSDDTVQQLQQLEQQYGALFGQWQLICQDNLGFGAGHHRALSAGSSPYGLVTNVDLTFDANALTTVMRMAVSDVEAQVASWELRQLPYEHPKYYDPVTLETNWSAYACVLLRRAAYEQVGGFEPQLFMYCEDVELSYRFRAFGYRLKYVPQATVHHYSYQQPHEIKPLQFKGGIEGSLCLRWRYGQRADVFKGYVLMLRLLLRPPAVMGARAMVWQAIKHAWAKRDYFKPVQTQSQTPESPVYFPFTGLDYGLHRDGAFVEAHGAPDAVTAPLVSIITRTYKGRGALLAQSLRSVLNQSYAAVELIVVEDGGSTQQALVQQLAQQSSKEVRFIAHPKEGRSATGNAGLAAASGQWLLFLDDDDLLFADHIEALVQAVTAPNSSHQAAYALAFEVHTQVAADHSTYTEQRFTQPKVFYQPWDYTVLQKHNFLPIQCVLFHRSLYEKHGGFKVELDQLEDWDLWLRYGQGQSFIYVPKTTSLFRSPASYTVRSQRALVLHESYRGVQNQDKKKG